MTGDAGSEKAAPAPDPAAGTGAAAGTAAAAGTGAAAVRDIDRRIKPSEFFVPCGAAADGADPMVPVAFRPDQQFLQQVDKDVLSVRQEFATADPVERLFPARSGDRACGALDHFRSGDAIGISCVPKDVPLLVIGDAHGDSWSLAAALRLAREPELLRQLGMLPEATRPAVVLLGDLVDRGSDHVECALLALERMRSRPDDTVWIAGNHDIGHRWSPDDSAFVSELSPAEFADWLNAGDPQERARRIDFGKAFLEYVSDLPRAVAFGNGLLAVHGGVPHCDIFHTLGSLEELKRCSAAKDDFTWIRVAEKAPVKYPNRSRRGCELGTEQLVASVAHISSLLEREGHARVQAVVRGHDHHDDRHFVHRAGFPPMSLVTVNTMGAGDDRNNPFITGDLQPCVAVYVPGSAPRIVKIVRPVNEPDAGSLEGEAKTTTVEDAEAPRSDAMSPIIRIVTFRWFGHSS